MTEHEQVFAELFEASLLTLADQTKRQHKHALDLNTHNTETRRRISAFAESVYAERAEECKKLQKLVEDAKNARNESVDALRSVLPSPYPSGTRLRNWRQEWLNKCVWRPTEHIGLFEIWSKTSIYPLNTSPHRLPDAYAPVVRITNDKGNPLAKFKHFTIGWFPDEMPEEEIPEEERRIREIMDRRDAMLSRIYRAACQ